MKRRKSQRFETLEPRLAFNTAPAATDDTIATATGASVDFNYLTLNDFDADSDPLQVVAIGAPTNGSITSLGQGAYRYTPNPGFVGVESFSYTVSDGDLSDQANVRVVVNAPTDASSIRNALLAGVSQLADPNAPGRMVTFSPTAVDIAYYPGGVGEGPMIAAGTLGQGRVVALPDHQWLRLDQLGPQASTGRFYLNSIEWLTGTTDRSIKIVLPNNGDSNGRAWLNSQGYTNVVQTDNYRGELPDADVLIGWLGPNLSGSQMTAVRRFAENGGGLFLAEYGQGYNGYNGWWGRPVEDSPSNVLLRDAGIAFAGGTYGGSLAPEPARAQYDLDRIVAILSNPSRYTATDRLAATTSAGRILDTTPIDHTASQRVIEAAQAAAADVGATPASPVTSDEDKALLTLEMQIIGDLPPRQVTAHPTAEAVFGAIPADAERVTDARATIDTTRSGWLETGYYAAPGDLVTLEFPTWMVNQGYRVQISGHVDNISGRSSWDRAPFNVARSFPIDSTTVEVANAFGGTIYIDVGAGKFGPAPSRRTTEITINGAIAAPTFVLGQTTNREWVDSIRQHPAPYAELVSDGVAMSVPSAWIRDLNDPERLMTYWNDVVTRQDWVGGYEALRTGPERFNVDVQISVGLLHAGYPIQGPTWASQGLVDYDDLVAGGNWGYFHELGHEMQRHGALGWGFVNPYTFDGDVEVTVNIFANAALENQVLDPGNSGWGWSVYPDEVMRRARANTRNTRLPDFDQKDPYPFYFQLADSFGWDAYREVLKGYVEDQQSRPWLIPQSNQAKKDQWLTRWSGETGYDLTNYMVNKWGLEVSANALAEVAAMRLPDWLPAAATIDHFAINNDSSRDLNVVNTGISLDGFATFDSIEADHGTLRDVGRGIYRYTPDEGYVGADVVRIAYASQAGNVVTTEVRVDVRSAIPALAGDFDRDGTVTDADRNVWLSEFGRVGDALAADGNRDGRVNAADYTVWRDNLGQTVLPPFSTATAEAEADPTLAAIALSSPVTEADQDDPELESAIALATPQDSALLLLAASRRDEDPASDGHETRDHSEDEAAAIDTAFDAWNASLFGLG